VRQQLVVHSAFEVGSAECPRVADMHFLAVWLVCVLLQVIEECGVVA
jgi:hypothetical protein